MDLAMDLAVLEYKKRDSLVAAQTHGDVWSPLAASGLCFILCLSSTGETIVKNT